MPLFANEQKLIKQVNFGIKITQGGRKTITSDCSLADHRHSFIPFELLGMAFAFSSSRNTFLYFRKRNNPRMLEFNMLNWALTFLVLALIAALFGFGGIAASATSIAQVLFFLFVVLFVVSLIAKGASGRNVT